MEKLHLFYHGEKNQLEVLVTNTIRKFISLFCSDQKRLYSISILYILFLPQWIISCLSFLKDREADFLMFPHHLKPEENTVR